MLPYISHLDVSDNLLADDYGDGGSRFGVGGLCCPNDALDAVMNNDLGPDRYLEAALGVQVASPGSSPPPPPLPAGDAVLVESAVTATPPIDDVDASADMRRGAPDEDDDVWGLLVPAFMDTGTGLGGGGGLDPCSELLPPALDDLCGFFPDDMMVLEDMDYFDAFGGGDPQLPAPHDICGLFLPTDTVLMDVGIQESGGAPPLLPHAPMVSSLPVDTALWATSSVDTSAVSLAVCPSSSPTRERETEALPVFPPLGQEFVVPRKRRSRPATRRRNQSWSPNCLLNNAAKRVTAPRHHNPSSSNNSLSGIDDVGGGGGVLRQRQRRRRNRHSQRVCSHCERTDTPQWRAGPEGPGTLCNACGIRYGMGKLHPLYRPTNSPSYQSDKHSNRHRKVVKLMEKNARMMDQATNVGPGVYVSAPCQ